MCPPISCITFDMMMMMIVIVIAKILLLKFIDKVHRVKRFNLIFEKSNWHSLL